MNEVLKEATFEVEQIYTACLSQGSYYIRSGDEAVIIDPLRETTPYLERAKRDGVKIKYVFETHFHADFVSGHLDLAGKVNAPIVYGPGADPAYDVYIAHDGEEFQVGEITIVALHTPGHTPESTTWLLKDASGTERAIFTGDTLFLGDVGRPDLAQESGGLTKEDLAGMLYDSLQKKILPLPDDILIYPGHGAGSACGKNMMDETVDTLGNQKKVNYALQAKSKEEFIKLVTEGLEEPPAYFPENVRLNREGCNQLDRVLKKNDNPLSVNRFSELARNSCSLIIDTRSPADFCEGFIVGSVNIGLDGQFAPWVGALVTSINRSILLICEPGREQEAILRMARIGYDRVEGYLEGGIDSWKKAGFPLSTIDRITAERFEQIIADHSDQIQIWDVRRPSEFELSHVKDAINLPLSDINDWSCKNRDGKVGVIYCRSGYRSMIAASILKAKGHHHILEVEGGFNKIKERAIDLT